jgi:uncharacterized protein (TIGR03067 family)
MGGYSMKGLIAIFVAGFIVSLGLAVDEDSKADLRKLEGTWEVVSFEVGGKKVDPGKGAPEKAVIKDGKATFFAGGKEIPTFRNLKLELDPKKKPKEVNLVRGERERLPCIYEVTEEELKLAMPLVPKERKPGEELSRPESFDSKDKPVVILTAKRSKG